MIQRQFQTIIREREEESKNEIQRLTKELAAIKPNQHSTPSAPAAAGGSGGGDDSAQVLDLKTKLETATAKLQKFGAAINKMKELLAERDSKLAQQQTEIDSLQKQKAKTAESESAERDASHQHTQQLEAATQALRLAQTEASDLRNQRAAIELDVKNLTSQLTALRDSTDRIRSDHHPPLHHCIRRIRSLIPRAVLVVVQKWQSTPVLQRISSRN